MERFYYKSKEGKGFLNLKSPLLDENYIQITKEEFNELTKPKEPTAEEKAAQEKAKKIAEAQSEGETSTVSQLRDIYKEQLAKRKEARDKINELEK